MIAAFFKDLSVWRTSQNHGAWLPYCEIDVHSDVGDGKQTFWALIDSGAQFLMLPHSAAENLDIDTRKLPTEQVTSALGQCVSMPWTWLDVTIRGERVPVIAFFGISSTPLIGIETIKSTMRFGVDDQGWLHGTRNQALIHASPWFARVVELCAKIFGGRDLK